MTKKPKFSKLVNKQTLAEQVATTIKESIIDAEWEGGDALPTEPELAEQFGVSRAVIRDATRMLAAQGLVEARHGLGVFVTHSQTEAFGEALLVALRRNNATVWDIEHFEQIIFPEVFALATRTATDEEIARIKQLVEENLEKYKNTISKNWGQNKDLESVDQQEIMAGYRSTIQAIFDATHNRVFQLIAQPLLKLRNVRNWQSGETLTLENILNIEEFYFHTLVEALASRDPDFARATIKKIMELPEQAVNVMHQTPIGEVPIIPTDTEWVKRNLSD